MTGYAIKSQQISEDTFTIEVKTLNSKFFDFSLRCPEELQSMEEEIKKISHKKLLRGKVDIRVRKISTLKKSEEIELKKINQRIKYLKKISPESTKEKLLELSLLVPTSPNRDKIKISKKYRMQFLKFFIKTIDDLILFRLKEGRALHKAIVKYLNQINLQLSKIEKIDKTRVYNKKKKIMGKLGELLKKTNKVRLEEELVYYIEKLDISEEIVRLNHHLSFFDELLTAKNEIGKKLNFLVQEMNREINTIGSKSNDFKLQKSVVLIKEKIEKIKEQIQNVL
jgi:uncharacterized protein (TIGR00255 family)